MKARKILLSIAATIALGVTVCAGRTAVSDTAVDKPVSISEDAASFTLSNGIVTIRVAKSSGDLQSLVYKGIETLTDRSGHPGGYWSHDAGGGNDRRVKITIDPEMVHRKLDKMVEDRDLSRYIL